MKKVFRVLYIIYALPIRFIFAILQFPKTYRDLMAGKNIDEIKLNIRTGIDKSSGTNLCPIPNCPKCAEEGVVNG